MSDQGLGEASAQERRPQPGMSVSHTPGPWSFLMLDEADVFLMQGPEGDQASSIYEGGFTRSSQENAANAFLIAAAPDLLAALRLLEDQAQRQERAVRFGGAMEPFDVPSALSVARAAIAKATSPSASIGGS